MFVDVDKQLSIWFDTIQMQVVAVSFKLWYIQDSKNKI